MLVLAQVLALVLVQVQAQVQVLVLAPSPMGRPARFVAPASKHPSLASGLAAPPRSLCASPARVLT